MPIPIFAPLRGPEAPAQTDMQGLLRSYDPSAPLAEAWTLPAGFYLDPQVLAWEGRTVFARAWQVVGRAAQVRAPGQYLSATVADEPILVVRGQDGALRAFYNVCRHHAAQVMVAEEGCARVLRCPYHGWTYALDGRLTGTPDLAGLRGFDPAEHGLVPVRVAQWEGWVLVQLDPAGPPLEEFLGADLMAQFGGLRLSGFHFFERRRYELRCNWKVYVDNYLDGGYHVPHIHRGLGSVLDYRRYEIACGPRFCLQHSPMTADPADPETSAVRCGDSARYYWIYPNFMINWYEGVLDTNLVVPLAADRTAVVFDFYFTDVSEAAQARNRASMSLSQRIQEEDVAICESVQRGLGSRAYQRGRLSVRREAGEHCFHRLLHADLSGCPAAP